VTLQPGVRLGSFEILAAIGAGGMGEVYRARDSKLERDIAIKVLPAELSDDPGRRNRLLAEARAAAALNHPHICTVHQVGTIDGRAYLAMELVEGATLASLLSRGPLPREQILVYGRQIADALAHAHARGVVHRDLKSANIMVTEDGRAKILDFGLAARFGGRDLIEATTRLSLNDAGSVAGTLPYMAPEQLRGQSADTRSDIWALGIVLYEMSAGRRPFTGQTGFELSSAIFHADPPPLPSSVPVALQAVTQQCLVKEPARRYQQAGEVRAGLDAIRSGVVPPPPTAARVDHRLSRRAIIVAGGVGIAIVLAGVAVWLNPLGLRDRFVRDRRATIRSIAVLPLQNLSGDAGQEYFVAGVHEALITDLSRIGLEKVIAKASVDSLKGTTKSIGEIARDLGVEGMITGSVVRANDRVQISAQLVQAETGSVLWANRYERGAGDVLALQNDVVSAIAREVRATLSPEQSARLGRAHPVKPDAHDAYLKARSLFAAFVNTQDLKYMDSAFTEYEHAIQLDPTYAPSYAGLSRAYETASEGSWRAPKETFPKARVAALKAVELDDELAEAHAALAEVFLWFDWNWAGAEHEIQRALQLNPDSVDALTASEVYATLVQSRADEAIRTSQRILEVDPLNPFGRVQSIWVNYFSRRYDESIAKAKTLMELSANNLMSPWFLASNYAQKGMPADVVRYCDRVMEILGNGFMMQPIAQCAANLGIVGETARSRKLLRRLEQPVSGTWLDPMPMGDAYASVRDVDRAVSWYQRGLDERSSNMIYLKVNPLSDPVRNDARFQALLYQMKFPS
jgi:TolB-like protein